jgi:hypothetical protein
MTTDNREPRISLKKLRAMPHFIIAVNLKAISKGMMIKLQ